jgi:YfiH family protein
MTLPALPEAFYWTEETWGVALRCRPLEASAHHLFTTRQLALSSDDGYRQLAESIGAREVIRVNQVHGIGVVAVGRRSPRIERPLDGDILVSDDPAAAIAVRAADCVPLLMADATTGAVAAVHAGWRGTAARAAAAAVDAMAREFGTRPGDLTVAIGPSIGPCCYEVGPDLVDAFAAAGHERHLIQRWFATPPAPRGSRGRPALRLDIAAANRDQLILAGVPEGNIHACGLCTAMHLDVLTSYRAEKEKAGRIAGAIRAQISLPRPSLD